MNEVSLRYQNLSPQTSSPPQKSSVKRPIIALAALLLLLGFYKHKSSNLNHKLSSHASNDNKTSIALSVYINQVCKPNPNFLECQKGKKVRSTTFPEKTKIKFFQTADKTDKPQELEVGPTLRRVEFQLDKKLGEFGDVQIWTFCVKLKEDKRFHCKEVVASKELNLNVREKFWQFGGPRFRLDVVLKEDGKYKGALLREKV
jgi:hypothetical protein